MVRRRYLWTKQILPVFVRVHKIINNLLSNIWISAGMILLCSWKSDSCINITARFIQFKVLTVVGWWVWVKVHVWAPYTLLSHYLNSVITLLCPIKILTTPLTFPSDALNAKNGHDIKHILSPTDSGTEGLKGVNKKASQRELNFAIPGRHNFLEIKKRLEVLRSVCERDKKLLYDKREVEWWDWRWNWSKCEEVWHLKMRNGDDLLLLSWTFDVVACGGVECPWPWPGLRHSDWLSSGRAWLVAGQSWAGWQSQPWLWSRA